MQKARRAGSPAESVNGPKLHGRQHGMVYAADMDEKTSVPEGLLCPCCDVSVVFRRASSKSVNGGLEQSQATFVTKPGHKQEHKRGCEYVSPDVKFNMQAQGVSTLRQAIADGHYIRMNLNFIRKGKARFKRPNSYINQPEELRRWKKQHAGDYYNVPIDSLDGYIDTIKDIRAFAEEHFEGNQRHIDEMFEKIYVHYLGRLQTYKDFSGNDKSELREQFAMAQTFRNPIAHRYNRKGEDFVKGRPIVLEVKPADFMWRRNKQGHTVAEPRIKTDQPWQGLYFEDRWDDEFKQRVDQLKTTEAFLVVAEPVMKLDQPVQARQSFEYVAWKVRSVESVSQATAYDLDHM